LQNFVILILAFYVLKCVCICLSTDVLRAVDMHLIEQMQCMSTARKTTADKHMQTHLNT